MGVLQRRLSSLLVPEITTSTTKALGCRFILCLFPLFGYAYFFWQVKRERETRSMQLMSGVPWETVTLTTLSRDQNLFPQLLSEARELAMRGQEGKLVIHTAWGIEWRPFGQPRQKRPIQSVVLEPGVARRIESDIKTFLERRQWYADRGWLFTTSPS